jgi:hypothetical protein
MQITKDWDAEYNGEEFDSFNDLEEIKETFEVEDMPYEFHDDLEDIDYSSLTGNFDNDFDNFVSGKMPLKKNINPRHKLICRARGPKPIMPKQRVIVPTGRDVIVEGKRRPTKLVYHKGEKLSELILQINNDSELDFSVDLFNPTWPLQYMYATSGNLDNKIKVAGADNVTYSDVLFYLLANPTIIRSAIIDVAGLTTNSTTNEAIVSSQLQQSFRFKAKNIKGWLEVQPARLFKDNYQFQSDTVEFPIQDNLNRPFVPDGMETLLYTILANSSVTLTFYYKQVLLKELVFDEVRLKKSRVNKEEQKDE